MLYLLKGQETGRLLFRKIQPSDYSQWLPFFETAETSKYWIEEARPARESCDYWYAKQFGRYENGKGGMNALIEKESGQLIGHAGLLLQTVDEIEELEVAYSLLPAFWNKGYATEAAKKCMNFAFENDFRHSLISIISKTNLPSENVARKNGMKIDKETIYGRNEVNIFRITKDECHS